MTEDRTAKLPLTADVLIVEGELCTTWFVVKDADGKVLEDRAITDEELVQGTIRMRPLVSPHGNASLTSEWYPFSSGASDGSKPTALRIHIQGVEECPPDS